MANTLQLTSNITIPNITKMKLGRVFIDEDNAIMQVEVSVLTAGNLTVREDPFMLTITNGNADAVVADAAATAVNRVVRQVRLGGAGVAAAFTTALAGYRNAGADKRGNLITALLGVSGTVLNGVTDAGALSGTTQPVLPAGTVS